MKYSEMGRSEFLAEVNDYINTLEEPIQRHEADPLTEEEWIDWIKKEAAEKGESLDEEHIGWIVEKLEEDGYVGHNFEICMNWLMDRIEFYGSLEDAKKEAEDMIAYTQQDIVIYKDDEEVARRRWCGIVPDRDNEDFEEDGIIEIGDGYYSDWL